MRHSIFILITAVISCLWFDLSAQYLVQRDLTFAQVIKFEQSINSSKKADVRQGPVLEPTAPGLPEIEIYKRALVFQRIVGTDTIEVIYSGKSNLKIDDKSRVNESQFTWRPSNKENLIAIRDSLLRSLDGTPRMFTQTKKKFKKKAVVHNYVSSDSLSPAVTIEYIERAKRPVRLQLHILYNASK